jgi:asparagine synthase (glutamine-hydrolysing)
MCGIAAMVGLNGRPADQDVVEHMTRSILHRGPDDKGIYMAGSVGFGFTRLAILDLTSAAHQPMISTCGQFVLVFNGEIFNYVELREELLNLGYTFKSTGDTEVLLHAYRQWGSEFLHKLNGMWAFIVFDKRRGKLFGSRDRFGIKPLYRYQNKDCVLFGSEIKAIRASGLYRASPNWRIAARFLLQGGLDEDNESFYYGIEQISPGTAFELDLQGRWKQWSYWSLRNIPKTDVDDPANTFAELFEDAVRLRMRSDVPVGVSLSGGLDSTAIICAAARFQSRSENGFDEPLLAFSYNNAEFDESSYIADTVEQTRAELKQLQINPLWLWDELGRFLWFQDEPVHTMTAIIGFKLMRLAASNGIKVVLNGQGSDETVAGYRSYFRDYWYTLFRHGHLRETLIEINAFTVEHGGKKSNLFLDLLRHLIQSELVLISAYRRLARWKNHSRILRNSWFTKELSEHLSVDNFSENECTLDAALRRSVECAPLPLYLRVEDRNSMAHSVEVRLPFLDYRLVSLVFGLPANWKMRGPWNKFVLREAMRNRIPESVRTRVDKMGFPVPTKEWFASALYEPMQDLLNSQGLRERGIYNVENIRRDLELHRHGKIDVSVSLFNIVQFEIWRTFEQAHTYQAFASDSTVVPSGEKRSSAIARR